MNFTINNLPKVSFNKYNSFHWTAKKKFKDTIRLLTRSATKLKLKDGYSLEFKFYFKGRKIDTVNCFHYCKIIEDVIFLEDKNNGKMCISIFKSNINKVEVTMKKSK